MEIIGVFKTHFDYGYTDLAKNIRQKYRTDIIAKVIDVCCKTEQTDPICATVGRFPLGL